MFTVTMKDEEIRQSLSFVRKVEDLTFFIKQAVPFNSEVTKRASDVKKNSNNDEKKEKKEEVYEREFASEPSKKPSEIEKKKAETAEEPKQTLDKEEERQLRELPYYHGFFSRDDLQCLLKNEGDFMVRITDVETNKGSDRQIILCVMTYSQQQEERVIIADTHAKNLKVRNVIVTREKGKYKIDQTATFDSIKALVAHYQQPNIANPLKVRLRFPVGRMNWEYSHDDIQFTGKQLGEGAFGEVRAGTLRKKKNGRLVPVAVKMPKVVGEVSKEKVKEMMKEARLMRYFKHKNVVRLLGVAVLEQPIYILLELVDGGSLVTYLEKYEGLIAIKEKINMCSGAANGLEYLHKCGCIHRDVAARNCLYTNDKIVKISDFGLSRLETIYKIRTPVKLPIKWLAPETITQFIFSTKSDVYSYGVMIYEIFMNAKEPWDGYSNTETKKSVTEGRFLELPKECPEKLRGFISDKIFVLDPKKRVSMSDVVRFLDNVQTESKMAEVDMARVSDGENLKTENEKSSKVADMPESREKLYVAADEAKAKDTKDPKDNNNKDNKDTKVRLKKTRKRGLHVRNK